MKHNKEPKKITTRRMIMAGAAAASLSLLAACGADDKDGAPHTLPVSTEAPAGSEIIDENKLFLSEAGRGAIGNIIGSLGQVGAGGERYDNGNFGNKPSVIAEPGAPEIYYSYDGENGELRFTSTQCDETGECFSIIVWGEVAKGKYGVGDVAPLPADLISDIPDIEIVGMAATRVGGEAGLEEYAADLSGHGDLTFGTSILPVNRHNSMRFVEEFDVIARNALNNTNPE
jgi:hypothetical protein